MKEYKVILKEKNKMSKDITQFIFTLEDDYNFYPGQWIDFFLKINNKKYIGGYSLASTPLDKEFIELAVKNSNNKVTNYLHEFSKIGEEFYISQAQGNIYFDPSINKEITLIAGGIGITPLISILRYAYKIKYPNKFNILYSVKNIDDLVYKNDIENIIFSNSLFKSYYFITNRESKNYTGRINKEILETLNKNSIFFLCGPRQMIDEINNYLLEIGVNKENILYEKWW